MSLSISQVRRALRILCHPKTVVAAVVLVASAVTGHLNAAPVRAAGNVDIAIYGRPQYTPDLPYSATAYGQWLTAFPQNFVKGVISVRYCNGANCRTYDGIFNTDGTFSQSGYWPNGSVLFNGASSYAGGWICDENIDDSGACYRAQYWGVTANETDGQGREPVYATFYPQYSTGNPSMYRAGDCQGTVRHFATNQTYLNHALTPGTDWEVTCFKVLYDNAF